MVYFLKMAHNLDSPRDREAPSSVLYKISVDFTTGFGKVISGIVFPILNSDFHFEVGL